MPFFLIKPPTLGAYRSAAQKCMTLIAFWAFAAAVLRVVDYLVALSLDLPRALYDSVAMTAFNVITGFIARWLVRQLGKGEATPTVISAFSGVLFVFTVANLAIGVVLAPRYAEPSPDAVYGNNLAAADHQHVRRGDLPAEPDRLDRHVVHRSAGRLSGAAQGPGGFRPKAPSPEPATSAPPTIVPPTQPVAMPRIVRLKEDSTTVLPAPATRSSPRPPPRCGSCVENRVRDRAADGTVTERISLSDFDFHLDQWQLRPDGEQLRGVLPVRTSDGARAVLKIASPTRNTAHLVLRRWAGNGAARLLRADPPRRALLLERLRPGSLETVPDVDACEIVAGLYRRLHVPAMPQLRTLASQIAQWSTDFETLPRSAPIPHRLIEQAHALTREFADGPNDTVLHGDLHYGTVLAADREPWLAIAPKPLNGDPHYEIAPMLWNRWEDLAGNIRHGVQRTVLQPHRRRRPRRGSCQGMGSGSGGQGSDARPRQRDQIRGAGQGRTRLRSNARRTRAVKQLLERNVEVVDQPPQVGQQVRAGDDADVQLAVQRHRRDVQPAAVEQRAQWMHRLDFAAQEIQLSLRASTSEMIRLWTGFPMSGESATIRKMEPNTALAASCAQSCSNVGLDRRTVALGTGVRLGDRP